MARRRKTIMGIPVGRAKKKSPSLANLARVGALGATALAAVPAAQRGMKAVGRGHEMIGRGQELAGKAGDALGAASDVKEAVSSHSSTVGKAVGMVGAVAHIGKDGKGGGDSTPKLAHLIEEHTDVSVPRSVAYNQWTQMKAFPSTVKGVAAVDQKQDDQTEWSTKIGPVKRQWKAKIVEQVPDERIAWRSESGPEHRGVVTFHSLDDDLTRVMVQMHYVPHGPLETVGNKLRIQRRRVRRDLRLFKHFLELRGEETGAWRGSIGENSADRSDPQSAQSRGRSAEASRSSGRGSRSSGSGSNGSRSSSAGSSGRSSGTRSAGTSSRRSSASSNGRSSGSSRARSSSAPSSGRGSRSTNNGRTPTRSSRTRSKETAK